MATVPEVLADLSCAIGNKVRRELPDSDLVRRIWNSTRDLRDVHGVSEEAIRTSCRKAGETEHLEQESKVPQGNQLQTCCLHTTMKLSAPAKRSIDWVNW